MGFTSISIIGYKSIKKANIELTDLNILVGANGAGKSNFISFFILLNHLVNKEFQTWVAANGFANRILHFGKKETSLIKFKLFMDADWYDLNLVSAQDDKLVLKSEEINRVYSNNEIFGGCLHNDSLYGSGLESSLEKEIKKYPIGMASSISSIVKSVKIYHFHDTGEKSVIKSMNRIDDNRSFNEDGSNVAAYLYYLKKKHEDSYLKIEKTISLIAPYFDKFVLEPDRLNEEMITVKWLEKGHNIDMSIDQLSDGTLRFICFAVLLLQPEIPHILLIDEPELGLHPYAMKVLSSLIKKISKTTQVIVSTQSATFIDNFELEDLIIVDKKDGSSTFNRYNSEEFEEWLEDYTVSELWDKNLLGGRP